MTRIAALVPLRHHSERVAGKNYRDFAGCPLYFHIVSVLFECPSISEVVIDTDSPRIADEAPAAFNGVRILHRPEHLRAGETPMNEVLLHDIKVVEADYYLQTHSTNPLLRRDTIEEAVRTFLEARPDHDSLFGVTRVQTRLYGADGHPLNHDPDVLLRTQDLPPVYEENSNLYIFDAETLRQRRSRIGHNPLMFEVAREEAIDIDDELDFAVAEFLYLRRMARS